MIPNIKIENILYATDLSENARYAFAYALSLADLYGANLILLHVLPETSDLVDKNVIGYIGEEKWEAIKQNHFREAREALIGKRRDHVAAKAVLDQFCEDAKRAMKTSSLVADDIIVERGSPEDLIIKHAEEKHCDLIVMGTHGRRILGDARMGSTARRVVRRSKTPVLVVRLPE